MGSLCTTENGPDRTFVDICDRRQEVVSRNAILLLLLLHVLGANDAADCVLHLWYSMFITEKHFAMLKMVKSLVDECMARETLPTESHRKPLVGVEFNAPVVISLATEDWIALQ